MSILKIEWQLLTEIYTVLHRLWDIRENLTLNTIVFITKSIVDKLTILNQDCERFVREAQVDDIDVGDLIYKFETLLVDFLPCRIQS